VGNKNFMDDVAFFLANTDLRGDLAGSQPMRTYVIGYGDSSPMLQSIAYAGQGVFYRANDLAELRAALLNALGVSHPSAGSAP
jgi:type IV pilus assembly protein PilY1